MTTQTLKRNEERVFFQLSKVIWWFFTGFLKSWTTVILEWNQTANPNLKYKGQLLTEVKEWKKFIFSACANEFSTPNLSYQESDFTVKIKSYVSERPNLESYLESNQMFLRKTDGFIESQQNIKQIRSEYDCACQQLISEAAQDVVDTILQEI